MTRVDNSILKAVATCSTQALLRYRNDWEDPKPRLPLRAGSAAHHALAGYLTGHWTGAEALQEFVRLAPEGDPAGEWEQARLARSNTTTIMGQWFATHPLAQFPLKVTVVEQPFRVPLCDGVEFVGVFDGLGTDRMGRTWLLEHKTTGRVSESWWDQFHLDSQLSGYIWAARQLGHDVPGAMVNAIELSKLPGSTRKCLTHGTKYEECGALHAEASIRPITRTKEVLDQWYETAKAMTRQWVSISVEEPWSSDRAPMEGQFNGSCRFCPFNLYCRLGRPAEYLAANFVKSPWRPLERG